MAIITIHMDTNMDMECIISHMEGGEIFLHGVWRHSIQIVNLHGVWGHSTLHNIHMDTDMDRRIDHLKSLCLHIISHMGCWDIITHFQQLYANVETQHGVYVHMEYQSTWSVETLHSIHMDTNRDMDTECIISHMECGDIL